MDASLATPTEAFSPQPTEIQSALDAASAAAGEINQLRIVFISRVTANTSRSSAIFRVTVGGV